jgi:hypothetical protein
MGLVLLTWFHPGVRQARETNGHLDLFDAAPATNGSAIGRTASTAGNGAGPNGAETTGGVQTAVSGVEPEPAARWQGRAGPPGRHSKKGRGARA